MADALRLEAMVTVRDAVPEHAGQSDDLILCAGHTRVRQRYQVVVIDGSSGVAVNRAIVSVSCDLVQRNAAQRCFFDAATAVLNSYFFD
jgi:hypothetical protein